MFVNLGDKPPAGFTEPLELMKDCHRRIEHYLDVLQKVEQRFGEGDLNDEARRALQAALNYFANFAPHHTADEERSLFPRMRSIDSPEVHAAMAELDRLERDHRQADAGHAQVDELVRRWLAAGRLEAPQRLRLQAALAELHSMYADHINLEEERVFVLASRVLGAPQLREIGDEMKLRRAECHSIAAPESYKR